MFLVQASMLHSLPVPRWCDDTTLNIAVMNNSLNCQEKKSPIGFCTIANTETAHRSVLTRRAKGETFFKKGNKVLGKNTLLCANYKTKVVNV